MKRSNLRELNVSELPSTTEIFTTKTESMLRRSKITSLKPDQLLVSLEPALGMLLLKVHLLRLSVTFLELVPRKR